MFIVTLYYGGERPIQSVRCQDLQTARSLGMLAEHSEIINEHTNEIIE